MEIYPSILTNNFKEFETKINLVRGLVNTIHLDIIDGVFVNNKTIYDIDKINSFNWNINYELHLMVEEKEIEKWLYSNTKRVIFHIESIKNEKKVIENIKKRKNILFFIKKIKENGKEAGIAVNPETDIENIFQFLYKIDIVLLMSVKPGKSGQKFIPKVLEKVKKLRDKNFKGIIEIDGGVNKDNIQEIRNSGVNAVSVASYIWESDNINNAILNLKDEKSF